MSEINSIIGVDLGGTNMRAASVIKGSIREFSSRLVPKTDDEKEVTQALIDTIRVVFTPESQGIGVGVPSLVKATDGIVYDVQNIPAWKDVPLKEILEKEFACPVYINNDANCFAVGERFFGVGTEYEDFVGLITGTGLGSGIIKNGHLLPDQHCGAGEFGSIPYRDEIYESYCSGQFFERQYQVSGRKMAKRAIEGDEFALDAFAEYGRHLGCAIKTILFTVDPKAIVLGGSVSKSFSLYKYAMWEEINHFPYPVVIENLKVIPSNVQEIAILGAAALCMDAMKACVE